MATRGHRAETTTTKGRKGDGMSEANETPTQGATAEEGRMFTQAEVDAIVSDRLKRERAKSAEKYAGYDEYKAKAAKFDEAAEASKSELQKAVEERDRLQAKLDKLEADRARADAVAKAASEYGVDADLLMRMSGDPDENAAYLKEQMGQRKYPSVPDFGEAKSFSAKNTAQQFADAIDFL